MNLIGFNDNFEIEEWRTKSVHAEVKNILEKGWGYNGNI